MKKILILIDWFLPGYKAGGQIPSVSNIVKSFAKEYDFFILTSDRDLGDNNPYSEIKTEKWLKKDGYQIYYINVANINKNFIKDIINEISPDIIYLNSFFSYKFTILPLLVTRELYSKIKIVLAPRGMLGKGALQQKQLKKKFFIWIARKKHLYKNVTWHASSVNEKQEIEKFFGKQEVIIASDIPNIPFPIQPEKPLKRKNDANFFFLSRISQKKNLLFALRLLQQIKKNIIINFAIIGPVEDQNYWLKCQREINTLPENIKVKMVGQISNPEIPGYISSNFHFFLFPTLHENFGHVIHESLAAGCPVIISNQTPWKDLEKKGIGWDIPLEDKEKFIKIIEDCACMDQERYSEMSLKAHSFSLQIVNDPESLETNRKLFS